MLNQALRIMLESLEQILHQAQPTVYLYGSVMLDDFRPGWSDIDLLVLTQQPLTSAQADQLLPLRQTLAAQHPHNELLRCFEGCILPLEAFLSSQEATCVYWGTSGQRIIRRYPLDSFSMLEVHRHSRLLLGQDVRFRLPVPTFSQLKDGIDAHLTAIRQHARQTGPSLYAYGWLLDIARCLYTLETGGVISKTGAAQWALTQQLCPVPEALTQALQARHDPHAALADPACMARAATLGPDIQRFADVLEARLDRHA